MGNSITLFQSSDFIFFFTVVFISYWLSPNLWRNKVLLIASYLFYASWDYRFLLLLLAVTLVDYFCAFKIKNSRYSKIFLAISLCTNFGNLILFKFVLNILPIGISFYTFQSVSYILDVYKNKTQPVKSLLDYSLFVSYFPQIISGPIHRLEELLPSFQRPKIFKEIAFEKSFYLFGYGLFKKLALADPLHSIVIRLLDNPMSTGAEVALGALAFTLQLYCDFSGYTDMARGISGFFSLPLSKNFDRPFFSPDPSQFWRRWHISLSNWVRDYLYLPLLFKSKSTLFSLLVSFLLIGIWHGPKLNYLLFGFYWFFITLVYHVGTRWIKTFPNLVKVVLFFPAIVVGLLLFKANTPNDFCKFIEHILMDFRFIEFFNGEYKLIYLSAVFVFIYEGIQVRQNNEFFVLKMPYVMRVMFYLALYFIYRQVGGMAELQFIYFQF